jgi:DUF4097 and DUF4098 domain-containing protein YvlB
MKTTMIICCALIATLANAQTFSEKITKELTFEKKSPDNTLLVSNINGDVKIIGYEGDKILLEVNRQISGKTEARLEKGKQEVQLNVIDQADTLIIYTKDGCNSFTSNRDRGNNNKNRHGWGYNWCGNNCQIDYDYKMDFTIKVPSSINVIVSTVNDGDLTVEKMSGVVKANNINGSIRLSNLKREADASTINGDVDVEYTTNPQRECRFYSLNGDINAMFPKGLAANLSFESFNGNFYTNIDKLQPLPLKVEKTDNATGVRFKVSGNRYKIGTGGALLDFETFNGDVYLKEIE